MIMSDLEKRKTVASANLCRSYLYLGGFITDKQGYQIHEKIKKFIVKNKVYISREQLKAIDFVYNDNPEADIINTICHEVDYGDHGKMFTIMERGGYAIGRVYTISKDAKEAYIEGLHVSEVKRKQHYGTCIINMLIAKCKDIGASRCILWCDKRKWTHSWYNRLGFVDDGDKQDQKGFVWMVKELK